MSALQGKNILVGITGSIAAYKAAMLVRLLVREGAAIRVVMTSYAKEFITPLTMATLSKHPILVDFFNPENGEWNSHVDLGNWADLYIIAPATANTMGKMAHGIADNLLITTYLSAKCDVMVAPAMDLDMYQHPSNLKNVEQLRSYGNMIIEAASGELASGLSGKGRMEEPEKIVEHIRAHFDSKKKLKGRRFVVTAGPTYEAIDPVRFIGNHSSGKMGYAIAEALASSGARVDLISGPVSLVSQHPNIHHVAVQTADEMYDQTTSLFKEADGAVLAAAVSDFKPVRQYDQKMKRGRENRILELEPTRDIAQQLGSVKKEHQLLVGFALETQDELANARKKIQGKNLDWIVLNSLSEEGSGFQVDTNRITIIDAQGQLQEFPLKSKHEAARDIVQKIMEAYTNG
ncbi:MAG: bifunctional phosphopantothenoylcysteine decarboxylase/phosphopantothenate--cysteine ligase CoaBC [Bacteroidales bacterium]|nr:bifunctional phosphopantothenoylcysteine decarboxylase/phosphopantothenate--cysteine ligase CoaBC [Bacteroidales bacterium]